MTDLEQLQTAFPDADEVYTDCRQFGFGSGVGVRFGESKHAVRRDGSLDDAIAELKRISRR